jgi:hypothetical protein
MWQLNASQSKASNYLALGDTFSSITPSREYIHSDSADKILRAAFQELGIEGASTHSFCRTCLTQMHFLWCAVEGDSEDFRSQNLVCPAKIPGGTR